MVLIAVSCQKSDTSAKAKQTQKPESEPKKELTFPFCSDNLDYSKKDKQGYFVYTDDFRKSGFGPKSAREFGSFSVGNVFVTFLEVKPIGDENTEPIAMLYTKVGGKLSDSLSIHETIDWEGNYEKRFCISKDKTIEITEASNAPDLEQIDAQGNAPVYEASAKATYRIEANGKFTKISSSGSMDDLKRVR
ncbi:hypothetical protein [Flavobacterium sp.]|uniref:hypothetical protein n=1 Tax=Flavobacterium sp. TaxID=239 RepID=UPI0012128EDC|nr:hypothetical protein [Flavobacterium sp.]RZJ69970.1 MAG: hypothetical protein EOO49_15050 [Flavobacterium sp.]